MVVRRLSIKCRIRKAVITPFSMPFGDGGGTVEKDVIHRNLNPAASGTSDQSRNDDSTLSRNDDSTLKESSESGSCGDDTLKRSYRSVLIGVGK